MAEFTEKANGLLPGPAGRVTNLEREAEGRFEKFVSRALKWLEEELSPRSLILAIWDEQREINTFHVRLSRDTGKWRIEEEADYDSYRSSRAGMRSTPKFALKSQFCYELDLPPRWAGMATLEFSGIAFLNPQHDAEIRNALRRLSKDLTIILLGREVAHLEKSLAQERTTGDEMRAFVAALSKELYCVSSISNALVQSYNVEEVLTRVLEQMLPFLRATLGVIYFPETGQCLSFHFPRKRERQDEPWFRRYFQSKMPVGGQGAPEQTSFHTQSVADHPGFPAKLKERLASQGIDYVLEFGLHCRNEFLGLGLVGLQREQPPPTSLRLLMISLNMIGLFLEHIILIQDLERQVKLVSQEKLEMEKRNRFLLDYMGTRTPGGGRAKRRVSPTERLLDEIERSRNAALLAELASGVAHQIRNPLSNLLYALHLLKQDGVNEGEKRELIESATERVENINRTITQFIQYTRIPKLHLSLESINDVVANTVKSFNGWMDVKAINFEISLDPMLPPTRIDIFLINQAFHDIIKNALEATPDCGCLRVSSRKLNIRHGPEPRLEFAEIVFEDNGPGIDPEDLDKVLKPFYSKKEGGLGLGLALVDHVIRAHGGAVTLTSRQEGGTRVKIYLPIR